MAQKVTLIDDINGKRADETVSFGIDGVLYEIDLTTVNAGKLRKAYAEVIAAGRKVKSKDTRTHRGKVAQTADNKMIREWARSKGYANWNPDARGRIPSYVVADYQADLAA